MIKIFSSLTFLTVLLTSCSQIIKNKEQLDKQLLSDTAGVSTAPVKIILAKTIVPAFGSTRKIFVRYRNMTDDLVDKVKFHWYEADAETTSITKDTTVTYQLGYGLMDAITGVNEENSTTIDLVNSNTGKLIVIWPFEVVFSNGAKWELSPN